MRGIWRVTRDGRFFGDYRAKGHALQAIAEARQTQEASGQRVSVVIDDGVATTSI